MEQDALLLVLLRNRFYRKQYLMALLAFIMSLGVIVYLGFVLYYLLQNPVKPIYFAADKVGRLIDVIPTSQPNMDLDDVMTWTINAVQAAYSFDYLNYRSQFQEAQKYFTQYGWNNYMSALSASNNLLAVTTQKLIALAQVQAKPKVINQGLLSKSYAYRFEMPLLVTYLGPPYDNSPNTSFQNALLINVIVQRQPILQSNNGLGIVQIIATTAADTTSILNTTNTPSG